MKVEMYKCDLCGKLIENKADVSFIPIRFTGYRKEKTFHTCSDCSIPDLNDVWQRGLEFYFVDGEEVRTVMFEGANQVIVSDNDNPYIENVVEFINENINDVEGS